MKNLMTKLWKEESAVSATEYGIIAALIAVGLIGILGLFRNSLVSMFTRAKTAVGGN